MERYSDDCNLLSVSKVREHFPFPLMQNGSIAFYFSLDDALWSDWRNARLHRYSVL